MDTAPMIDDKSSGGKPPDRAAEEASAIRADATPPDAGPSSGAARRGRPPGSKNKAASPRSKKAKEDIRVTAARNNAVLFNGYFFKICAAIAGDEMKPDEEEKQELDTLLTDYLITKDDIALPPGVALAIGYGVFIYVKAQQDTVKETLKERLGVWRTKGRYMRDRVRLWKERRAEKKADQQRKKLDDPSPDSD